MGDWVGPRASLDGYIQYRSHRGSVFGLSSQYGIAIPTALPGLNSKNVKTTNCFLLSRLVVCLSKRVIFLG